MKILLDLSINYQKGPVQIKDVSRRQDIPIKYLEQIILILKGGGYVRSKRGPGGGVFLSKTPSEIKLGEIIRLMDGTTSPITCVSKTEPSKCDYISKCPFIDIWKDIRDYINIRIDRVSFADIVEKYNRMNSKSADYTI